MRKMKTVLLVLLVLYSFSLLRAELVQFYRKGKVNLNPSAGFGVNTRWEDIIFNDFKEITVDAEGTIYMTNGDGNCFYIISPQGDLLLKKGRKGQGPGDLNIPGSVSMLDNKFLIIKEFAETYRISVFDRKGKFIKILRTTHPPNAVIALKENMIAYSYIHSMGTGKKSSNRVVLKNINSGREKLVYSVELDDRDVVTKGIGLKVRDYSDFVIINRTVNGNLMVGVSISPELKIFDVSGNPVKTLSLKMEMVPVTDDYIQTCKQRTIKALEEDALASKAIKKQAIAMCRNASFDGFFGKYLPLYSSVMVDGEGNILVFEFDHIHPHSHVSFHVYTANGEYVCNTQLFSDQFMFTIKPDSTKIWFGRNGIVGVLSAKGNDKDENVRLVKFDIAH
jgi:hypothetical protein